MRLMERGADRIRVLLLRDLLINTIAASILVPGRLRWVLLRSYGVRIERAAVRERCYFGSPDVAIGRGAYINTGVFFDGTDAIEVGARVHLGMQVMILTGGHQLGSADCRAGEISPAPVRIGDGAWIGARAVVMPGVRIGAGAVVAAGAVVVSDCEPGGLYGGAPARLIRHLD